MSITIRHLLFLFFFLLFQSQNLISQVFVSEIIKDHILIGPNNVSPIPEFVADEYLEELENFLIDLEYKEEEFRNDIDPLDQKQSLGVKETFKLGCLKSDYQLIFEEMIAVDQLIADWQRCKDRIKMHQEVFDILDKGGCLSIETNQGLFPSDSLEIGYTTEKEIPYYEILNVRDLRQIRRIIEKNPVTKVFSTTNNKKERFRFEMKPTPYGTAHTYLSCPDGFSKHPVRSICIMENPNHFDRKTTQNILNIIHIETDEVLSIKSWEVISCIE